jgi:hypothetical protein
MKNKLLIALLSICLCNLSGHSQTPETSAKPVYFKTSDSLLQKLYNSAEEKAKGNLAQFGKYKVLVEGAGYGAVWLETQPMGGYMYGKRDLEIARNNIEIFMDCQREDGRLPGMVTFTDNKIVPHYEMFQGFCFAAPAIETWYLLNKDKEFIGKLYQSLERFDAYLWKTRDSDGDGCLETWCECDTGEDGCVRLGKRHPGWSFDYPPTCDENKEKSEGNQGGTKAQISENDCLMPIESMDFMSYSYASRNILAKISKAIGNGQESYWRTKADDVRRALKNRLWDKQKRACYDRDRDNKTMDVLFQGNIKCMYYGSFDQQMANEFIRYHLMNRKEFWMPFPLPSIAANDKMFRNEPGNNWSGQPQGLTYQRSISALENYGHYAELTLIGKAFLKNLEKYNKFTQQYDPYTGEPNNSSDGYGPTILTTLELVTRLFGIHISEDKIYWSCLDSPEDYQYAQQYLNSNYRMATNGNNIDCFVNGQKVLSFSKGIRVITDLKGKLLGVVGIETEKKQAIINFHGKSYSLDVAPNACFSCNGKLKEVKRAPFYEPFHPL